jgi:hypothetical protein
MTNERGEKAGMTPAGRVPKMRSLLVAAGAALLVGGFALRVEARPPCTIACGAVCGGDTQVVSCEFHSPPCRVDVRCADGHFVGDFVCDCGGSCLLAGTEITMADGSKKPIEEIAVGDVVLAYDEKSGEMKPDRVKTVYEPADSPGYLVINGSLQLTMIHPVLTPDGFKEIGKLKVGDRLVGADQKEIEIASIERKGDHVTVYNFHTNPYQTYVANGVIVHNKEPQPSE